MIIPETKHGKYCRLIPTRKAKQLASILISGLLGIVLFTGPACGAHAAEDQSPIRFGLLPFLSQSTLVKKFNPLISYMEETLKRRIEIRSAPDFKTYTERAINGEYDVFLAAPHISAYMEQRHQSRRVARFARKLKGYFVVHVDSSYKSLSDLRGKRFAFPDPLAVITLLGERALVDNGIDPDTDLIRHYTSHNNALHLVSKQEQDAAVVGVTVYDNTPEEIKRELRILDETSIVPSLMFHTRSGLPDEDYQAITAAMLKFTAAGAGKEFFSKVAYGDMISITDKDIELLNNLVILMDKKLQ